MNSVLIDCERMKYPNNGLFHFCLGLCNALAKVNDPQVCHLGFYVPEQFRFYWGSQSSYIRLRPTHRFAGVSSSHYRIWHATHQNSAYFPRNGKTKLILTVHDLNFLEERKGEPGKIKAALKQIQKRVDRAERIVCISAFTRNTLSAHIDLKGKDASVIYNGCSVQNYPGFDSPGYRPLRPYLLSVGTVLPKKNFHVLPCLLKGNEYELIIAGNTNKDYQAKIMSEAALHNVKDRVIFTGPVSEEEKYWYYKNCLAFLFPSLAEGFGLPVIEAMHFGKPVFLSGFSSLPEIGGSHAYYFHSFDSAAMQEAFRTGMINYRERAPAAEIKEWASRFNWEKAAKKYLSMYMEMAH